MEHQGQPEKGKTEEGLSSPFSCSPRAESSVRNHNTPKVTPKSYGFGFGGGCSFCCCSVDFLPPKIPKILPSSPFFFSPSTPLASPGAAFLELAAPFGGVGSEFPPLPNKCESQETGGACDVARPPCKKQYCVGSVPAMNTSCFVVGHVGVANCSDC